MEAKTQTPTVQESTIVERVARIVSSVRGSKPDYTLLATELEPAIPFDVFGVVLLRHDRQAVRVTVCQRVNKIWRSEYHQHPLEGSRLAQLLQTPRMVVSNHLNGLDGPPAESGDALSGCHQLRATVIAPLVVGERVLGTLELGSTMLNAYADSTLQRLIDAVVRVLAAAIESAQMGGSAEIQDRQRQALKDVSSALASKTDISSIFTQIVEGVAKALNVASAIVTIDNNEGRMRLKAQSGLNPSVLERIVARKENLGEYSIIGYTLQRRQPCVSNDIYADERFPHSYLFTTELGIRSIFSHPLATGTTVYGTLLLCSSEPGGFTPLKTDILSLFASQATIAIHNGMLIESAQQRSRFQDAIEQLERVYTHNGDEQAILAQVRDEAKHTFGVSFSSILHFISDHLLTRNERELHAILQTAQQVGTSQPATSNLLLNEASLSETTSLPPERITIEEDKHLAPTIAPLFSSPSNDAENAALHKAASSWQKNSVVLLTQTAEAALVRAEVVSELGRLWSQLHHLSEQDHVKDAWFVIDLTGLCIYMNPAAESFCGLPMGTTTASTLEDVFVNVLPRIRNSAEVRAYLHDFHQGMVNRKVVRCALAVEPVIGRFHQAVHEERNGYNSQSRQGQPQKPSLLPDNVASDHHYQFSRYPLYNQQNRHIANVLQIHDVTEQVHEEKNKSALLSSVSHDLRTPLTTIKAAVTGLLQEGVVWDEETRREILEDIDVEADHLNVLVHALIEMSRIEMGALALEKEWCDIIEIVHGAMIRLERVVSGRQVCLQVQPDLPLIYADHVQLERVFYNLIENAVRHSPDDQEILLTFEAMAETSADATHDALRVRVIDRGEEVPVGERERIFKTFYGPNLRGGGMGLAICRGIIEAHGGHIRVETAPDGHGSSFVFTLPIHSYNGTQSSADESVIASEQGEPEDSTRSNVFSPNQEPASKTNTIAPTMEGSQ